MEAQSNSATPTRLGPEHIPPLIGDSEGKYRILVLGNSGSGKSTTARELGSILSLPFFSVDELHWGPGWYSAPGPELREKVQAAFDSTDGSWVVDGDYRSKLGNFVIDQTTDIIWLDPPLALYFPRIFIRTLQRIMGWAPPCAKGCDESFREAFLSSDSILWWCLTHHWSNRERNQERMKVLGITPGRPLEAGRKMRRLGGWGTERETWLKAVKDMVEKKMT